MGKPTATAFGEERLLDEFDKEVIHPYSIHLGYARPHGTALLSDAIVNRKFCWRIMKAQKVRGAYLSEAPLSRQRSIFVNERHRRVKAMDDFRYFRDLEQIRGQIFWLADDDFTGKVRPDGKLYRSFRLTGTCVGRE